VHASSSPRTSSWEIRDLGEDRRAMRLDQEDGVGAEIELEPRSRAEGAGDRNAAGLIGVIAALLPVEPGSACATGVSSPSSPSSTALSKIAAESHFVADASGTTVCGP
jgi:hypothetical protein